ncbi:MAG: alpha-glucosidase [SAR86 cluster bacterium]|uniref:Alpha-glucosidase n=1 Tax=SAR86 cluster bacterium TaxID=2030880 RepID=A0A520MRS0_9GAMM|nr:MAG: alpha-glucosidase [SAR86 cluster bacterium]|tara:strand:+ start:1007 stop:2359 length:1353 start_codon:yes stop_codon:yes gene_type:complete
MNNWKNKVIYQIYPRSFQDTSGNGIGDLNGISSRVDYIADLGVDYIWISPFFESPQKDFGYDVSNYRKVDKIFGSNDDFKRLIDVFHKKGIGVITDLVLSHTSDEHEWFKESRNSKINQHKDWYVWQDGEPGSPPNNWLSVFGGSAWKWDETREQYYLHNFLDSQPDLNFHNQEVQDQMLSEINFWLDFGVDGFRFDVINFLYHDKQLRNNPAKDPRHVRPLGFNKDNPYGLQVHKFDNTQPETLEYLTRIRALLDKYNAISVGEIVSESPLEIIGEYANENRLHMAYCFEFLSEEFDFLQTDKIVKDFFLNNPNSWPCWSFSNHDSMRIASRIDLEPKIIMEKLLELDGNICIYQGEELGLKETNIAYKDLQDPFGKNFWPEFKGRDGCRTPMPWNANEKNLGFSSSTPWLPSNSEYVLNSVNEQIEDKNSMLNFTKKLIRKRKKGIAT